MSEPENKNSPKTRSAFYVRCNPEEFQKLIQDEQATGESAATLLRRKYFTGKQLVLMMPSEERKAWFSELKRIGNNLNQLARRVNSGFLDGWYEEFTQIAKTLSEIERRVVIQNGSS